MSLIRGYLNQTGQVKREGALEMYDGPADTAELDITPLEYGDGFKIKAVKSGGEAVSHIITIYGYLEETPRSEVIDFGAYANRTKYGLKTFTAVDQITTTLYLEDPIPNLRVVACDAGNAEIVAETWEDFPCKWEERATPYWNDVGSFILSDAKVITSSQIEAGDWIRLYPDDSIIGREVKSMKPATGLGGAEEFRTLLL